MYVFFLLLFYILYVLFFLLSYFNIAGLDFDAILLKPKDAKDGTELPLIVKPHGNFSKIFL